MTSLFITSNNTPYMLRLIRKGGTYGKGAVHDSDDPLVEFWADATLKQLTPYRISSYYATTLLAGTDGINLGDGFQVDAVAMAQVRGWLRIETHLAPTLMRTVQQAVNDLLDAGAITADTAAEILDNFLTRESKP